MFHKLSTVILLTALLAILLTTAARAAAPHFEGASADGSVVFFTSADQLVPGDTDNRLDVYERSFEPGVGVGGEYVTRELSTGPTGGTDAVDALYQGASSDGSRVFLQTAEPLVAADTDRHADVYARNLGAGSPELVTVGEADQNGADDASFAGATPDGEEVVFTTTASLSNNDQDGSSADLYVRDLSTGQTHLVSAAVPGCASCDEGAFPAFGGIAAGGQRVFFATSGRLSPADTDSAIDIYARDLPNGPTELVSEGAPACRPVCGNDSSEDAVFAGSSADGSKVFFETAEPLVETDTDAANDVYEREGSTAALISAGTEDVPANIPREGGTLRPAISDDGSKVFFQTTEPLLSDSDQATDIYERSGSGLRLATPNGCTGADCGATYDGMTPDGSQLAFSTEQELSAQDEDDTADIYVVPTAGGPPVLVTVGSSSCQPGCGNGPFPTVFNRLANDGSVVLFGSQEPLSPLDGDGATDIFAHQLGADQTTLVSSPGLCPLPTGCDAGFAGASVDASKVFFVTSELLDSEDRDSEVDLYERERPTGVTRLVSRGNEAVIGPSVPTLTGTNPVSPGASTTPAVFGRADPGTSVKLFASSNCTGAPLQTQTAVTASQLEGAGIVVTVPAGATTKLTASAFDQEGVASGCSAPITYTQQDPVPPPADQGADGDGPASGGGTGTGSAGTRSTGTAPGGTVGTGSRGGRPSVTYVDPEARITFGPAAKTRVRRPVFRFFDATGQAGSTFLCKLDRRVWRNCTSPLKVPALTLRSHVFSVIAVNALGVRSQLPVRRTFRVVG